MLFTIYEHLTQFQFPISAQKHKLTPVPVENKEMRSRYENTIFQQNQINKQEKTKKK